MKAKKAFQTFINTLSDEDKARVQQYLKGYWEHCDLPSSELKLLTEDAKASLMYLTSTGLSVEESCRRLSSENLGGFYAHKALSWYPLDDAAKVYPLSIKSGKMPMFRLSCYLKEDVVPEILQSALDFTIKRFPSFATIIRKGIFWHYLDSVKRRFHVTKDSGVPCQPLRINSVGLQSFRVMYYRNRISAEFFHVLTDGSGGMIFLKTLVAEYLHLLGAPKVKDKGVFDINEPPMTSELSNDFERLCPKTRKSGGFAGPAALQMGGKLSKHTPCKVVQLVYDTDSVMELCHRMGISVTTLTLSLMFLANRSATELNKGLLQFQVPVNMRKFFPESNTMRNFSMYCSIDLPPSKVNSIEEVAPMVAQQLKQKTTYDEMSVMMTTARRLVTSVKLVPLIVKAPIARIIYGFLGDSRFSNTLSNLGKIEMPDELVPYIEGFDFILGTCVVSRASCSMCSFGGNTVLSISKNTKDPSFEERLAALSQELGIKPEIVETSLYG